MQHEQVLAHALNVLEQNGLAASTSFATLAKATARRQEEVAERQKRASWQYTHQLLALLEIDNPALIAHELKLILEGCLSRLLVKRNVQEVVTARSLAEDVLTMTLCRNNGALA